MTLAHAAPENARPTFADEEIPVLDLGPFQAGAAGALQALGQRMRHAREPVNYPSRKHPAPPFR